MSDAQDLIDGQTKTANTNLFSSAANATFVPSLHNMLDSVSAHFHGIDSYDYLI